MQTVLQKLDSDDPEGRTHDGSAAADDTGATEDHSGNDIELESCGGIRSRASKAGGKDEPGDACHKTTESISKELDTVNRESGKASSGFIITDGVNRATERSCCQYGGANDQHHNQEIKLHGHAEDFATAEESKSIGKPVGGAGFTNAQ